MTEQTLRTIEPLAECIVTLEAQVDRMFSVACTLEAEGNIEASQEVIYAAQELSSHIIDLLMHTRSIAGNAGISLNCMGDWRAIANSYSARNA